jgi:hypothetical protein
LVFQSFVFATGLPDKALFASFLFAMEEIVKPEATVRDCTRRCWDAGRKILLLKIIRDAGNLPAIVFAVEFVGKEIKFGLQ